MRVIAGVYRSRALASPTGMATRPTSDRLRETLFNILAARRDGGLAGARFADLYAGTGAVGIEALSRGASHCWFSEKAEPALKALRTNLSALKIPAASVTVEEKGTGALLASLGSKKLAMDVMYVDPPYEAQEEYEQTLGLLGSVKGRAMIAGGGVVVVEFATFVAARHKFALAERYGGLVRTRVLKQGETSLGFYEVGGNAEPV